MVPGDPSFYFALSCTASESIILRKYLPYNAFTKKLDPEPGKNEQMTYTVQFLTT